MASDEKGRKRSEAVAKIHDPELEKMALADLLLVAQKQGAQVPGLIDIEHFHTYRHIAEAMVNCGRRGNFDPVLLKNEVIALGGTDQGSFDTVRQLMADSLGSVSSALPYLHKLRELHELRLLRDRAAAIAAHCDSRQYDDAIAKASRIGDGMGHAAAPVRDVAEVVEAMKERPVIKGISTGWFQIDQLLPHNGYPAGEVTLAMGETGSGKTCWMAGAITTACELGKNVFCATIEMSDQNIVRRLIQYQIGFKDRKSADKMGLAGLWDKTAEEIAKTWNLRFYDPTEADEGSPTVEGLMDRVMFWNKVEPIHLVCVDYAQLLGTSEKGINDFEKLKIVSRKLKATAKRADVPLLALAQVTVENDKWHSRSCKELVNDSAMTIELRPNEDLVVVRKNRYGRGSVEIGSKFDGPYARFRSIQPQPTLEEAS